MNLFTTLRAPSAVALAAAIAVAGGATPANTTRAGAALGVAESYGKLPLRFEPATRPGTFTARGLGYGLWLEPASALIALKSAAGERAGLRMRLESAATTARAVTGAELPGSTNYFVGPRERWRAGVTGYGSVRFDGVYPGVDVVYYGNQGRLEYDFVVAPGADPARIRLGLEGARRLSIDGSGSLVIAVPGGELRLEAPVAYQDTPSGRRAVACAYELDGASVAFALGDFDSTLPLVIDPVLAYSTYLGGSLDDAGRDIAIDSAGNAYVTGETVSNDFPTQGAILTDPSLFRFDAFVTKINAAGTALVYSTYLGGDEYDGGTGIAVDAAGNAYVSGYTNSSDYPTVLAYQLANAGGNFDAFVTRINAAGSSITYSTYLGGTGDDRAEDVAVDAAGLIYLVGSSNSTDFPTAGGLQAEPGDANFDAFVSQINPASGPAGLPFSSYLGGSLADFGRGIALGATGQVFVTGDTLSANFPTTPNAFQPAAPSAVNAFVSRISFPASGPVVLAYSTYLGSSGDDVGRRIAADAAGHAYVIGTTSSTTFPTLNAFQLEGGDGAGNDAFVARLNTTATGAASLVYGTYLGGTGQDEGTSIAIDAAGSVYVTGVTASTNFPTKDALQTDPGDSAPDAFVAKLNTAANGPASLVYSTYLGGAGNDAGQGIAAGPGGAVYVTGYTGSNNFPTTPNAPQLSRTGSFDAFVTKLIDAVADVSITKAGTPDPVVTGQNVTYTISVFNAGPNQAEGVVVTDPLPAGVTFVSVSPSQGTCTAPAAGSATGTVTCSLGAVPSNGSATVTLVLRATGNPGTTITNVATVTTQASDPTPSNNTATETVGVRAAVTPPTITDVDKLKDPFRIKLTGTNFQPGAQVFIGTDTTPWPSVRYVSTTMLVLKKGSTLKARFPKGVAVTIRVRNPDGGEATTVFTR